MQVVAVEIGEEHQPVALVLERFADEVDVLCAQVGEGLVEIVDIDRQMADARILQRLWAAIARRRE